MQVYTKVQGYAVVKGRPEAFKDGVIRRVWIRCWSMAMAESMEHGPWGACTPDRAGGVRGGVYA